MAAKSSAAAMEVELISFKIPSEANVFIPKISWHDSREELCEFLRDRFSKFGLVYHVYADRCRNSTEEHSYWFSAIEFYSLRSAKRARLFLHKNLLVNGQLCSVLESSRNHSTTLPLSANNCKALANHYLGFNGWRSQILYHRLESTVTDDAKGEVVMRYCTAMGLSFPCMESEEQKRQQVFVDGAGIGEATFAPGRLEEKCRSVGAAQKQSRGRALQNAFAKVMLVVVDGCRVSVEIDPTVRDPFFYDPTWEEYEVKKVNVIEEPYCDEDVGEEDVGAE